MKLVRAKTLWVLLVLTTTVTLAAALIPVQVESRDALFEIPNGTWELRRAGVDREVLPSEIRLVLGLRDVLVLKNRDSVPQIFGPTLIMPGQTFRLPFNVASEYQFECTAHTSGQMKVIVAEGPTNPWSRLRYRTEHLATRLVSF